MGRELKRVPLDFNWEGVWAGYINPYPYGDDCPKCNGTGCSDHYKKLKNKWYGYVVFDPISTGSTPYEPTDPYIVSIVKPKVERSPEYYGTGEQAIHREAVRMCSIWNNQWSCHLGQDDVNALITQGRLRDFTADNPDYIPTASEVNRWSIQSMGHDSINSWICIKAKCDREGLSPYCDQCKGEGVLWDTPYRKWLYEQWERVDPPTGKGYQVWETVSGGSPISPVFKTEDELISWLIGQGYSEGAAEQFAKEGHAFSMMIGNGRIYKDIESLNAAHND